jgi:hypothetical protein
MNNLANNLDASGLLVLNLFQLVISAKLQDLLMMLKPTVIVLKFKTKVSAAVKDADGTLKLIYQSHQLLHAFHQLDKLHQCALELIQQCIGIPKHATGNAQLLNHQPLDANHKLTKSHKCADLLVNTGTTRLVPLNAQLVLLLLHQLSSLKSSATQLSNSMDKTLDFGTLAQR